MITKRPLQNIPFSPACQGIILVLLTLSACASPKHHADTSSAQLDLMRHRLKEKLDTDQDGLITCADARLQQRQRFQAADKDQNGQLNLEEFQETPWSHPAYARDHMTLYDTNHDALVSYEEFIKHGSAGYGLAGHEFTGHGSPNFAKLDLNGDCRVTEDELTKAVKNISSDGKARRRTNGGRPRGRGKP